MFVTIYIDPKYGLWVIAAFLGLPVIRAELSVMANRKRTVALTRLAETMGFRFEGSEWNDPSCTPSKKMELFRKGMSRVVKIGKTVKLRRYIGACTFVTGFLFWALVHDRARGQRHEE